MADVKVRVIGEDKASKEIAKTDKALGGLKDKAHMSIGSLTELASGLGLLERGLRMAQQAFDATAGKAIAYNKSILKGSQVTGMAVEAFSRLVQVGDDVEVSSETITTALAIMRQKGLQPSIESIADLADEYVAAGETSDFAEKATERLGRGWKELAPLLSLGKKGLIDATAAIDDNLIATEAEIKRTEELRLAIDNASDAWEGFAMEVGGTIAPMISYILTPAIKKVIDGQEYWVRVIGDTTYALKEGGRGLIDATSEYLAAEAATIEYTWAKKDELAIVEGVTAATEAMNYVVMNADYFASRASSAFIEFGKGLKGVEEKAVEATPEIKGFLDGINRDIGSPIANFIKDLEWMAQTGGVIETAFADIQRALDAHEITPEQAKEFSKNLLIAAKDVEVTLDPTKLKNAAADLEDTLGKAAAKVAMEDIRGTNGLEGALAEVTRVQRYLDFTFRYHGTPPSAYGGGSGYGTGAGLGGGGGAEGGTGEGGSGKKNNLPPDHGRATGGAVFGGDAYHVNEAQSEWLYMPKGQSGFVVPDNQMPTGGGGDTIIEINLVGAPSMTPEQVNSIIARNLSVAMRNMRAGGYARGG